MGGRSTLPAQDGQVPAFSMGRWSHLVPKASQVPVSTTLGHHPAQKKVPREVNVTSTTQQLSFQSNARHSQGTTLGAGHHGFFPLFKAITPPRFSPSHEVWSSSPNRE